MPNAPTPTFATPVTELWGVGSERAGQLARLDIRTLGDLLLHRPRRYEDRRHFLNIRELELGQPATTRGQIIALGLKRYQKGRKSVFEIVLDDGTARLHCRWWNLPFMEKYFKQGDEVMVYGKVLDLKPRTIDHPETEIIEGGEEAFIHINRIVPIYPLTEGLPQRWLRSLLWRHVEHIEELVKEPHPEIQLASHPTRANALHMLHFPNEMEDVQIARRRLALDEFIDLQLEIQTRRRKLQANAQGIPCSGDNHFIRPFLHQLGFQLTTAQTRVLRDIRKDMGGGQPMRRLLQGDVGAGKTVVAACTALMTLESKHNVVLMAPTEILAEQHYANFRRWLEPLGISVELNTGSSKTTAKGPMAHRLVIGTHALIEHSFNLERLGLVIIDEQHKFGVSQREKLLRKGRYPHLLVMTATPIPRTLGLTLYGDLDNSIIDELPVGRGRIKTYVRTADKLSKVWEFVREKLTEGRQAYVVYPRVEEDADKSDLKAVTKELTNLQMKLSPFQVGLLHGRMNSEEKERVMNSFRTNKIHVLLATTVIEVGVDVPNATVMLIENAEQFGLAQLHQLRGRIGRGAHDSICILVANKKTEEAHRRLAIMEETNDGFKIAEADLQMRGPGELLGREQSGLPPFRFGDLTTDRELIEYARQLAAGLLGRRAP